MVIVNVLATVGIPIDVTCAPDRLAGKACGVGRRSEERVLHVVGS